MYAMSKVKLKKIAVWTVILALVPLTVFLGITVFGAKRYAFVTAAVALMSVVPFFLAFEKNGRNQQDPR